MRRGYRPALPSLPTARSEMRDGHQQKKPRETVESPGAVLFRVVSSDSPHTPTGPGIIPGKVAVEVEKGEVVTHRIHYRLSDEIIKGRNRFLRRMMASTNRPLLGRFPRLTRRPVAVFNRKPFRVPLAIVITRVAIVE